MGFDHESLGGGEGKADGGGRDDRWKGEEPEGDRLVEMGGDRHEKKVFTG